MELVLVGAAAALLIMYTDVFDVSYSIASDFDQRQQVLMLDSTDIQKLVAQTGAGKLVIKGDENVKNIKLIADIFADDDADITLQLVKEGDQATLVAKVEPSSSWINVDSPYIDVTLTLPQHLLMDITDGSGLIDIHGMNADISLKDGSGSITIDGGENLVIEDGSGAIDVQNVSGNLTIKDGSGGITINHVAGNLSIKDGSGAIDVTDIKGSLDVNDGSGSMVIKHVAGLVSINDGSGSIDVEYAKGLTIHTAGSGDVKYQHIDEPVNL
ncbi:DUF4097 domain-containing protein [Shewanella sp. OMA3-2]|uniref:DUF4097 domain-containing protein n=1 Tax=Shewanella sp. OMA3-2 TaxID=2908650 RepID=UPI001F47D004|nr:DUF4097 domain-containing protein [Shewanella sp. OMA3-2]UJF21672.1 DUF4097 domain-containing protein [Shewanella sp. OMA3-2]